MTSLLWGDLDGFYEQCFVYMGLMLWHQEHWKLASVRWWGLSPDLLGRECYSCFFFSHLKCSMKIQTGLKQYLIG